MTEIPAKVLSIHDVAPAPAPCIEGVDWRPLRDELGVTAFGMNAYVGAEPGTVVVEPHDEVDTGHEEVYAVIAGSARFKLDGQTFDVAAPGFVKPDSPAVHREAHAIEGGTIVLAVGAAPDKPFEVSEWETRQHELGRQGSS
jgi:hypothetical protein